MRLQYEVAMLLKISHENKKHVKQVYKFCSHLIDIFAAYLLMNERNRAIPPQWNDSRPEK